MKAKRSLLTAGAGLALLIGASALWLLRGGTDAPGAAAPAAAPSVRARTPIEPETTIYDGRLSPGWEDWGWGPHELPATGPARVVFSGYGGIVLRHPELTSAFGALAFRYKAPPSFGDFLAVSLKPARLDQASFPNVPVRGHHVAELEDGWREVLVPWKELNPKARPFDRVVITAHRAVGTEWVSLDKIVLTKPTGAAQAAVPSRAAKLWIGCEGPTRPISPSIYGVTHGGWSSGGTAQRIGGNPLSRLNWDLGNVWNTGSDWFFENVQVEGSLWKWIESGVENRAQTALVVPIIGYVAKDATSVGFPVSKLGPQRKTDPHRPDAGDGFRADGTPVQPGPPSQTSVPAPPELIGRWITMLRERDLGRGQRSVHTYILDNEPSLWDVTHRDVHPEPLSYDELLQRTIRYGTAIRQSDPEGLIAGPAEWGWSGYHYSAKDRAAGFASAPDRAAHGGVPLLPWYLQKLAEHEKKTGVRVLDVLDVHFYPAGEGIFGENARTDRETAARRIRATRALWDPEYKDESWIKERVRLIPLLKEWVAQNYPGRKIMIGEWSFGADKHISGALATAEALGRFGQHGLDAAYYWGGPHEGTGTFWAFRAFRNFDGNGARFQDLSLPTQEAEEVSLFASRDEAKQKLVAVVLNRDPVHTISAQIELRGCAAMGRRRVFAYAEGRASLSEEKPGAARGQTFTESLEPYSLKVIELSFSPPSTTRPR